jgi:peptide/nickel transport system substrate-binding protein
MAPEEDRAQVLAHGYLTGRLSRRQLLKRSAAVGGVALGASTLGPLLAACGGTSTAPSAAAGGAGKPVAGGTLTAALTGNPSSLDPPAADDYTSLQVLDNIFSKLITMDENGNFIGELATSWTQDDPVTYTFNLVDNATFHNGEKFTADDVKYTFERIVNPKIASSYAPAYSSVKAIEVISPTKAVFHLSEPFAPLLTSLAQNGEIVNQKAIESGDPTRKPVGTGPFQFVEWVQNDHITMKKYPHYFNAHEPYLNQIVFKFLDVDESRIAGLQSGQLDWVDAVPLNELKALKQNPTYHYVTSSRAGIPDFLALNTSQPPFSSKALRQAVAAAVDRKEILEVAYFGVGEQGVMEVPSGSSWYGGKAPYANGPDLTLAKRKMAEAGYANGLNVTYLALPQYPGLQKTGIVLKQQLQQIGINVTIQQLEITVWLERYVKGDYQMTSSLWSETIDPDNFYSTQLATGSPNNATKYSNKTVDVLIAKARSVTRPADRKALYEQINYLMGKDVNGSTVNPPLELRFGQVWKAS